MGLTNINTLGTNAIQTDLPMLSVEAELTRFRQRSMP